MNINDFKQNFPLAIVTYTCNVPLVKDSFNAKGTVKIYDCPYMEKTWKGPQSNERFVLIPKSVYDEYYA